MSEPTQTPISLFERLRSLPDDQAWERLVDLYEPLIRRWLRRYQLQHNDIDDISQDVLQTVVRALPSFEHQRRPGSFRSWLRNIMINRLRHFWRDRQSQPLANGGSDFAGFLQQLEDADGSLSRLWDVEHDRYIAQRIMESIEPEFETATWTAFRKLVLEGNPTNEVAAELNITPNAVRIAKSRVLTRIRQEASDLID